MSDKRFGDFTNRNSVKNPLLSTAVTGLSIEDLTQNAVLLPAVPSQELITRQDEQHEPQMRALWYSEHDIANVHAGDTNSNVTQNNTPININLNPIDNKTQRNEMRSHLDCATVSEASAKSNDDFDVNEYFARLQGTRYVSAPLHSAVTDQNANLQVEENMEDINLNEPEKTQSPEVPQHSLTADIAQNFSQLPNVLPHVASAVFSSFSNMLSLKSREVTPDDAKTYQHRPETMNEALPVPEVPVKNVAPPPLREPPMSGTATNYRIITKKKIYAQLPGLSTGDSHHIQTLNTGTINQVPPPYFIPDANTSNVPYHDTKIENVTVEFDAKQSIATGQVNTGNVYGFNTQLIPEQSKDAFEIFNPIASVPVGQIETLHQNKPNFIEINQDQEIMSSQDPIVKPAVPEFTAPSVPQGQSTVIPPPPMFSNLPRRDNQTSVGKSVLPPSVARRISANQPIIKRQVIPTMIPQDNIFIPTIPFEPNVVPNLGPEAIAPSEYNQNIAHLITSKENIPESQSNIQSIEYAINIPQSLFQTPPIPISSIPSTSISSNSMVSEMPISTFLSAPHIDKGSISTDILTSPLLPNATGTTVLEDAYKPFNYSTSVKKLEDEAAPNFFQKYPTERQDTNTCEPLSLEKPDITPPMFFNPVTLKQPNLVPKAGKELDTSPDAGSHLPNTLTRSSYTSNEPAKEISEPPKFTGNHNYRLTKKKPQYYSGPIQGVGSISNNIKPILNSIESNSFQGALFTPDQNVQSMTHELITEDNFPTAHEMIPFDLNKPAISYPTHVNESEEQRLLPNDYSTAFDLSRPTTERYENVPLESKRFGIISSLKSKLGSIDINKIQSTVTTFFDPAYNDTKADDTQKQENITSYHNLPGGNYQNFSQNEATTLDVFLPSVNHAETHPNPYNYQTEYSEPILQNPPYYPMQEYFNPEQNYPISNYTGWDNIYQQQPESSTVPLFPNSTILTQDKPKNIETEVSYSNTAMAFAQDGTIKTGTKKSSTDNDNKLVAGNSKVINVHQVSDTNNDSKKEMSQNTSDIYDYSRQEPQAVFDPIISEENNSKNTDSFVHSFKSAFDNNDSINQPILHSGVDENISHRLMDVIQTSQEYSSISARHFFDQPQTNFLEIQATIDANADKKSNSEFELLQETTDISPQTYFDYPLPNPVISVSSNNDVTINKSLQNIFNKKIKTDVGTCDEPSSTKILPVQNDDDLVSKERTCALSSFDKQTINNINNCQDPMQLSQPAYKLFDFDHSKVSLTPEYTVSKNIVEVEKKSENDILLEHAENLLRQKSAELVDKSEPNELKDELLEHQVSELNICETCREVNKPEEKDVDDLTTQLIENITAPIQLANPVEYPLAGSSVSNIDRPEISHIVENIIETVKLPSPIELIDDIIGNISNLNFGWSTNESRSSKVLHDHDYNFQTDPISIGFFQDKTSLFEDIPTNASDEIKAEYRISQEDSSSVPRQIPLEEDTKSDESGLDVHSIELDAKKDFPLYEEFVIEPSETDDDKIEYKERERGSDDPIPDVDTFTNRVERYKKMETISDSNESLSFELKKETKAFDLPTSASPALTIASYFDTGNYAVENHYRNSLTSPSLLMAFSNGSTAPMRIPPGFEDEYKRRLSISAQQLVLPSFAGQDDTYLSDISPHTTATVNFNNLNIAYIPDAPAETRGLSVLTFSPSPAENLNISDAEVKTMVDKIVEDHSSPIIGERLPAFSNIVEPTKTAIDQELYTSTEKESQSQQEPKLESLPDANNFFTTNVETSSDSEAYNNFSRLSSYFTSPPKTDHAKSFFELSQSQDHYRHKPKQHTYNSIQSNVKNFFETTTLTNDITNKSVINSNTSTASGNPQNDTANMNLIRALTSCENFCPKDDIVRNINYFTVDYPKETNVGEPKASACTPGKVVGNVECKNYEAHKTGQLGDACESNLKVDDIINECKFCCSMTETFERVGLKSVDFDSFKIRKAMDSSSENKREDAINMNERKDGGRKSLTVNFGEQSFKDDNNDGIESMTENHTSSEYAPVQHHWFYRVEFEGTSIWRGFSTGDSRALELAFNSPELNESTLVATDGGRYDVNVMGRMRTAVYWADNPSSVMRCSWFYKGTTDPRYVPYTEAIAEMLEEQYRHSVTADEWHRRLVLPNNEVVVMHGPAVMVHFLQSSTSDTFASTTLFTFGKRVYRNPPKITVSEDQLQKIDHLVFLVHGAGEYRHQKQKIQSMMRPRVVRRGCVKSGIEDTEPSSIDHLLLMCHGVGSACDMRFRSVEEVVDDFRSTSLQLIQSHYKNSYDSGLIGRVEVLSISWHSSLHSGETGVDRRLAAVTLESIPRLRNFTNDTLLDVLFYTSPVFCQTIIDTVCGELNRIYALFKSRNPNFDGGVSLGGHSLGSVILYDLLCHQMPKNTIERNISTEKQYLTGSAGTGQPSVKYPHLVFEPDTLYALGSPIAIFECIRGVQTLGQEFCLPTCKNFFNIFHPYDPIAYRIEPMINPLLRDVKPYLIPHHKGRKRMHLELIDTMTRVGTDIKQKLIESIKNTWFNMWKTQPPPDNQLEKVVEEEMEKEELNVETREDQVQEHEMTPDMLGNLNGGRRIDHVLQEAPFEMINEYLFAMSSHVCYWESEDTMLVMLREIYSGMGVTPDCSVPQNTMTVQRSRLPEDSVVVTSPGSPSTSRGSS